MGLNISEDVGWEEDMEYMDEPNMEVTSVEGLEKTMLIKSIVDEKEILLKEATKDVPKEKIHKNQKTLRFKDLPWFNPGIDIIIGGVGGIGSWLSLFLARQECNLYLFDMDTIEQVNMGGQLYSTAQIGQLKTKGVKDTILQFTGLKSANIVELGEFKEDSIISPIVFAGFDNMKGRKLLFEKWKSQEDRELFIDGRMTSELGQIYAVIKGREIEYEKTLFDDGEVEEQPCSMKATSHCGAIIGGLMTSIFNNYITNQKMGFECREIPFKTVYNLPEMNFEVQ